MRRIERGPKRKAAAHRFIAILMTDNYNTSVWTKTEYKRALARQQSEVRVVMLPLLMSGTTIPDFIQDKVYIDFRVDYFSALVRLVAVVHGVSPSRVSRSLAKRRPTSVSEVWDLLENSGFDPSALLESADFDEVLAAGGELDGADFAHFVPNRVARARNVSPEVKALMKRLARPTATMKRRHRQPAR